MGKDIFLDQGSVLADFQQDLILPYLLGFRLLKAPAPSLNDLHFS